LLLRAQILEAVDRADLFILVEKWPAAAKWLLLVTAPAAMRLEADGFCREMAPPTYGSGC
jgi:hypothetical protein